MSIFWAVVTIAVVVALAAVALWLFVLAPWIVPNRHAH